MRLFELLLETPQEDKVLIQLGRLISSQLVPPKGKKAKKVGSLQQFIEQLPGQSKKILQNKLNDIQLEYKAEVPMITYAYWRPSGERGDYGNPEGTIVLDSQFCGTTEMASNIVHELRHVLDDAKSSMQTANSKRYITPRKKEHQNDEYAYMAQPAEINARFAQAMESLARAIPIIYKLPPEKIKPRIK